MFLYQAAGPAPQSPNLVSLEIEVLAGTSLDALPRRLGPLTRCPPDPAGKPGAAQTFYGNHFEIPALPFGCYLAALSIAGETRVEMAFPSIRPVRFDFRKIQLHGRVTRAGEGVAAALDFDPNDEPIPPGMKSTSTSAETDTSGDYEARVWPGALYRVRVAPSEGSSSPSRFRLVTGDTLEQEKDFALSANPLKITILDAKTHDPIPGAKLVFIDSEGLSIRKPIRSARLKLDSVPSGPFHATAVAKDYVNSTVDWAIEDRDDAQTFEIEMNRETKGNDFQVSLPDGSPAANAWAFYRYDAITDSHILIPCDGEGNCHPAERPVDSDLIFLKHPDAGLTILTAGTLYASRTAVMSPAGGNLVIHLRPGPKSQGACESAIIELHGVAIGRYEASGSQFVCGPNPEPLTLAELPAAALDVSIVLLSYDDHSRPIPVRIAGPITVTLPSGPIEISLP